MNGLTDRIHAKGIDVIRIPDIKFGGPDLRTKSGFRTVLKLILDRTQGRLLFVLFAPCASMLYFQKTPSYLQLGAAQFPCGVPSYDASTSHVSPTAPPPGS